MDFQIAESEILTIAVMCVNDFNYGWHGKKDVLLCGVENVHLAFMLSKFEANIHAVNCAFKNTDFAKNARSMTFYEHAINLKINQFDVIIDLKSENVSHYKKMLKTNGILLCNLDALTADKITKKGADFLILMPLKIAESGIQKYYIFASNKFHPIADFSIQKLDLMEDLHYCNERVYNAVYAMPNYIKKAISGVVRN